MSAARSGYPICPASPKLLTWIVALLGLIFLGAYYWIERWEQGLRSTALSNLTPWGQWVSFYIFFIGLSAGAFLLSSLVYVFGMRQYERLGRYAVFMAAICMVTALAFVLPDIGRMDRFYFPLIYWGTTSWLWVEFQLYIAYTVILVAELYFLVRTDLVRLASGGSVLYRALSLGSRDTSEKSSTRDMLIVRVLGAIGIPVAIGVHGGTGAIFAVTRAQALWFGPLTPIIFLTSAMASGGALLLGVYIITNKPSGRAIKPEFVRSAGRLVLTILFFDWFFVFWEIMVTSYAMVPADVGALNKMLFGPFAWVFWVIELGFGLVIPSIVLLHPRTSRSPIAAMLASFSIAFGILGVRFNIVIPSLSLAQYEVLQVLPVYFPRMPVEWAISVGLLGAVLLAYSIGQRILPLEPVSEAEARPEKASESRRTGLRLIGAAIVVAGLAAVGLKLSRAKEEQFQIKDLPWTDTSREGLKGKRFGMVIDLVRCTGCQACVIACKAENRVPEGLFRRWVPDIEVGEFPDVKRLFVPLQCNQCDNPPCVPVCPVKATWKREDGIVVVDWAKCIGCRYCEVACPYNARDFEWNASQMIDKCTFCAHRVEKGLLPACVEQCPAEVMIFGDLNDPNSQISKTIASKPVQVLKPELGTEPHVFYLGLPSQLFMKTGDHAGARVIMGNKLAQASYQRLKRFTFEQEKEVLVNA